MKLQCKCDNKKVKYDKKDKKIKMNIGNAFKELHFNIILNQDARIYASFRPALHVALTNRLLRFFQYSFLSVHLFIMFSLVFVSFT